MRRNEIKRVGSKLIRKASPPFGLHAIAGLKNRPCRAPLSAGHQTRMASVRCR